MNSVLERIAAERQKQIAKGYDAAHDDTHTDGAIVDAAEQLISKAQGFNSVGCIGKHPDRHDPRHPSQWHLYIMAKWKHDKVKMLTIAAALLVAEIERIERRDARHMKGAVTR